MDYPNCNTFLIQEIASISRFAPCVTFLLTVWAYLETLFASVSGGDSGELVAEGCELGIAHPPGYPLYTMLLHLTFKLGFSSPAIRANAMSAVLSSLASALITASVQLWNGYTDLSSDVAAIFAGIIFSFSPLIWTYAIQPEVFALNNFFASLLLFTLLLFARDRTDKEKPESHNELQDPAQSVSYSKPSQLRRRNVSTHKKPVHNPKNENQDVEGCSPSQIRDCYIGAFVSGLGLTNQHTLSLFVIPVIFWTFYVLHSQKVLTIKFVITAGLCFLLGLIPYAYLPISAIYNPKPGTWGDLRTFSGFFHHLLRSDYGTFRLYSSLSQSEGFLIRIYLYFRDLSTQQIVFPAVFLAMIGAFSTFSHANTNVKSHCPSVWGRITQIKKSTAFCIALMYIFYMVVFHTLSNMPLKDPLLFGVHARFWMQPHIIVSFWIGVGLFATLNACHRKLDSPFSKTIAYSIVIGLAYWQFSRNFKFVDQSDNKYMEELARASLGSLPMGALLLINYDQFWTSIRYVQICEDFRQDVTAIHLSMSSYKWFQTRHSDYPHIKFPGTHFVRQNTQDYFLGGFTGKQFLDANMDKFPSGIFLIGKMPDESHTSNYDVTTIGLTQKFVYKDSLPEFSEWNNQDINAMKLINNIRLPDIEKYGPDTWESTINRIYWDAIASRGSQLLFYATEAENILQNPQISEKKRKLLTGINEYSYNKIKGTPGLLIEGAEWLEKIVKHDSQHSSHVLKNLGVAYSRLVRLASHMQNVAASNILPTDFPKRLLLESNGSWSNAAAMRCLEVWKAFVHRPDAKLDPSYPQIVQIIQDIQKRSNK